MLPCVNLYVFHIHLHWTLSSKKYSPGCFDTFFFDFEWDSVEKVAIFCYLVTILLKNFIFINFEKKTVEIVKKEIVEFENLRMTQDSFKSQRTVFGYFGQSFQLKRCNSAKTLIKVN